MMSKTGIAEEKQILKRKKNIVTQLDGYWNRKHTCAHDPEDAMLKFCSEDEDNYKANHLIPL